MKLVSWRFVAFVIVSVSVWAQEKPERKSGAAENREQVLRDIDTDQDGFISREEWNQFFAKHDSSGDQLLSPDEVNEYRMQTLLTAPEDHGREDAFKRFDKDGNGVLSRQEWPGGDRFFNRTDANRDGALSREEFLSFRGAFWNVLFEDVDTNGEKRISRSEWLDNEQTFETLDRDRDGVIEREEFYSRH